MVSGFQRSAIGNAVLAFSVVLLLVVRSLPFLLPASYSPLILPPHPQLHPCHSRTLFYPPLEFSVHILRDSVRPCVRPRSKLLLLLPLLLFSPQKNGKKRGKKQCNYKNSNIWSLQSSQIRWLLLVPVRVAMSRLRRWRRNDKHNDERDKYSNALATVSTTVRFGTYPAQ